MEIAHLLDQLWQKLLLKLIENNYYKICSKEAGLMTYNLVMLSAVASSVIESAKSQVEWMSDKILRMFEMGRQNPFQFKHVRFCHNLVDLNRVRSPKVYYQNLKILKNRWCWLADWIWKVGIPVSFFWIGAQTRRTWSSLQVKAVIIHL